MSLKILVVSSCTGEKRYKPTNELLQDDFLDKNQLEMREKELESFTLPACEMYTGKQHVKLMDGIKNYRNDGGEIDLLILSAGYGILEEHELIVPYEVTFNSMVSKQLNIWSNHLNITRNLQARVNEYDMIFFLLGDKYLKSVEWPIQTKENQKLIFFAGESTKQRLLIDPNYYIMSIGKQEAKIFRSGLIEIKGYLFSLLLNAITQNKVSWESIYQYPEKVSDVLLDSLRENDQLSFLNVDIEENLLPVNTIYIPTDQYASNFGQDLRYFMPENDDRVDPNYDFIKDFSPKRDPLLNDVYSHELHMQPQYDGILISKVNVEKSTKKKRKLILEQGIREFLRLPSNYPIMGDCGAFSYLNMDVPPYTTEEVLDYYHTLGFNYGVSVDHLIVGPYLKDEEERNRRYELTLDNARDFIEKYNKNKEKKGYHFTPIGVVQGWDPASFRNAVAELVKMGYRYVALGGLAMEQSHVIIDILKEVMKVIPDKYFRMHLFGVVRDNMEIMKTFHKLGVTSFDSASPLRRAWLGSDHNYYGINKHYSAIRIPSTDTGRVKRIMNGQDQTDFFRDLEVNAINALREYDQGKLDLDTTLERILEYDEYLGENREKLKNYYKEVLEDKPWKNCSCEICKKIGIDIIVFRGNNRNRRRGFHNTYMFYQNFNKLKMEIKRPN